MKRERTPFPMGFIMFYVFVLILNSACGKGETLRYDYNVNAAAGHPYPDANFAVISDTHIYDPSLGVSGSAFEKTMNSDRKLLLDSIDLLDYASGDIIASGSRFVLVSGDLTKDGEMVNHRLIAGKLKRFTDAGIAVYVVPGNHDVNNPDAVRYEGDGTEPVASISAGEFAQIYGDCGFNAAIMRDDDSLSYVAEPADGLWLLAIDDCRYRENKPGHEEMVSGKISQKTADWITTVLQAAANQNKAVMVMMHHGIVEHWKGQAKLHPDYLITDYANFGKFLASWDVRFAFTGHYHAQDITRGQYGGKFLHDIETGSLITAPCPIRYVSIQDNVLYINSDTIVDKLRPGTDFAANARAFVKKTVVLEAAQTLRKYKVSEKDIEYIADAVGDAFSSHYAGDENPALRPLFNKSKLGFWGRFVYGQQRYVLDGLWTDIPPGDNIVRIEL
ncbi:MAG: metallophosphoesterase [Treponema sp.]|nr:metallophosphoesterase [Treponema sp.]